MFIVAGAPAHSSFKKTQLLSRLTSISSVQSIESQWVYLFDQALSEQQQQSALQLLNDGQSFELHQAASDEIQILKSHRASEPSLLGPLKRRTFSKTVIRRFIDLNAAFYLL